MNGAGGGPGSGSLAARLDFGAGGLRYPARHEVVDAVFHGEAGDVPAVVKKIRIDWRQRLAGRTKGERSFDTARAMLARGLPTPDPLGVEVFPGESWFACRRVEGGVQVREWFRHRYEEGRPAPSLPLSFEQVVRGVGRLARSIHDGGVFYRDFTDGNILVAPGEGEARFWLVDVERARLSDRPVDSWNRLRDLSRPGLNSARDRNLLLESYFHPAKPPAWARTMLSVFRFRIRAWDELKRVLRPWRKGGPPEGPNGGILLPSKRVE